MIYQNEKIKNISFPLGGIGSGSVGLAGNGSFRDWEIFNRPNKHSHNGFSHFALRVTQDGRRISKVLQGDCVTALGDFSCGTPTQTMAGFPHFRDVSFDGRFPVAQLQLLEENFPIVACLTAFNPFIPHDEDNSSLPVAMFEWELKNVTDRDADCVLGLSLQNPSTAGINSAFEKNGSRGIYLRDTANGADDRAYFDLCMLCDGADTVAEEYWYRGRWQDAQSVYWRNFTDLDRIPERSYPTAGKNDHATLAAYFNIPAGGSRRVRFVIAWNAPNMYNYWAKDLQDSERGPWKNYYATKFENSRATAEYAMSHYDAFYEKTKAFSDALQSCSLPQTMIDAISSNLSVLKSPTVFRLTDGSLWGWEGVHNTAGSCEGSCQHVWNYAYALPFLFPRLERSLRDVTLKYALGEDGKSSFRIMLPLGRKPWIFRACVDGQMGEVIKCYREWKFSGDTDWLRANAEKIFSMLEYAWSPKNPDRWDADMDGVMEGRQHHTLDMELFGPNSWLEGFYLLALDCGSKMAEAVGDAARAEQYRAMYENGRAWTNEHLFNGEYFCQKIDLRDKGILERFETEADQNADFGASYWNAEEGEIKYQIGDGCIIDQMLAEWHGAMIGAAPIFDEDKKRTALESLYRYNYIPSMRNVANMWRLFAVDDEAGTIICSYPERFEKPIIPIPYCEEVMTGFEYAAAGLMLANGYVDECETMVNAIRNRYDGEKRNPWDEIECGHNYARSMASYALMPIYSGFTFDMTKNHIGFSPIGGCGKFLFSICQSWGTVEFDSTGCRILMLGDPLTLCSISVPNCEDITNVTVDGVDVDFEIFEKRIVLNHTVIRKALLLK